jgi:hypothetical protein
MKKSGAQEGGMWLAFYQGKKSSISLWEMVREVTVASGESFVLSPLPLWERVGVRGIFR